jgi:hypothetical protein
MVEGDPALINKAPHEAFADVQIAGSLAHAEPGAGQPQIVLSRDVLHTIRDSRWTYPAQRQLWGEDPVFVLGAGSMCSDREQLVLRRTWPRWPPSINTNMIFERPDELFSVSQGERSEANTVWSSMDPLIEHAPETDVVQHDAQPPDQAISPLSRD